MRCCSRLVSLVVLSALVAFAVIAADSSAAFSAEKAAAQKPAAGPSHQVIACYFHRTQRCPTCRMISAYIEESVKTGFAAQLKDGSVRLAMIDFQDARNQKYTQAYQITGPTLVIMDVKDGKVASWKAAPKVWSLVGQKDMFFRYVQGEVQSYLTGRATASR